MPHICKSTHLIFPMDLPQGCGGVILPSALERTGSEPSGKGRKELGSGLPVSAFGVCSGACSPPFSGPPSLTVQWQEERPTHGWGGCHGTLMQKRQMNQQQVIITKVAVVV